MENKFEITKEIIEKMLSEKEMKLTYEEIEALMDSEVEKPEEEMDTELVSMCAEILARKYCPEVLEEKEIPMYRPWEHMENTEPAAQPKKKQVVRFKYVALVAAVLAVLVFVVALPAGAKLFDNPTSDKIIEFYEDCFRIKLGSEETTQVDSDWINELILENLHTRMLPQVLLGEEYELSVADVLQDEDKTLIYINVLSVTDKFSGHILITQYKSAEHDMTNGQVNIPSTHRGFKQLLIEDKEIIVFGMGKEEYINYSDGATNYEIALNCDFDTMVSIAETINVKG